MTGVPKRPRLYYGWWIVATGSLVAGIGSVNLMGFTVFFLPLSRELGTTRAITSLVHSVSRLEGGLLGPVAGWVIDRFGARRTLVFGSILGGLGFILLGTAVHSVWALFLVYGLVIGVGFNTGFFPAVLAMVNIWFVRQRTIAMSIVNASWGAAAFVLVPVLSLITIRYCWRVAAVFAGCLVLLTAIPTLLFIQRSPESMGLRPDGEGDPDGPAGTLSAGAALQGPAIEPDGGADLTVREALSSPAYWLLVAATNLRMLAYSAILVHFAPLLIWKGLSPQTAANLIGLWSLLVIPASLAGGYLGDRGNKRLIISGGMLVGAGAFLLLALSHGAAYAYLFVVLLATFDNLGVMGWSLLGDYFGRRHFATLRGIMAGAGSVGIALAPVYAGWVWDRTGSYTMALIPFALLLVVASVLYALLPRPRVRGAGLATGTAPGRDARRSG